MAILFYELLAKAGGGLRVEIVAMDIDQVCLQRARVGHYERAALKEVSAQNLKKFFTPFKGDFKLASCIKDLVVFKAQDLILDPGVQDADLILCRNVFIYFNRSLQEHLIMKFYKSLVDNGYFTMGNSENLLGEARQVLGEIDALCRIYQKKKIRS